jgi:hypothetical protein
MRAVEGVVCYSSYLGIFKLRLRRRMGLVRLYQKVAQNVALGALFGVVAPNYTMVSTTILPVPSCHMTAKINS